MQNSQWVKLQKPTTNQWVSNSEGCNTAAEEEVLMCVVGGVTKRWIKDGKKIEQKPTLRGCWGDGRKLTIHKLYLPG